MRIQGDKLLIAADANFTRARTILTTLTAATPAENDAVHSDALFKQVRPPGSRTGSHQRTNTWPVRLAPHRTSTA